MNIFKRFLKHIKGSQLVEKILIGAFSVSVGGAVIVYGASVVKNSTNAGIDEDDISGVTYNYNQLFDITKNWSIYKSPGSTYVIENKEATVTCSGENGNGCGFNHGVSNVVNGHKMLISFDSKSSESCSVNVYTENEYGFRTKTISLATEYQTYDYIITNNNTMGWFLLRFYLNNFDVTDRTYSLKNVLVIDLTVMYGQGHEPSSVAEFRAKFPKSFYPAQLTPTELTKSEINNLGE